MIGNTDAARLFRLAATATTVDERLAGVTTAAEAPAADVIVADQRLAAWRLALAAADEATFQRRLGWDGWSLPQVRTALGPVAWRDVAELPSWTRTLVQATQTLPERHQASHDCALRADEPLPFEAALLPFVRHARVSRHRHHSAPLTDRALAGLERNLLTRLVFWAAPTLQLELRVRRLSTASGLNRVLAERTAPSTTAAYDRLVADLTTSPWPVLERYPVLARLLATITEDWIEATEQFERRLSADLSELAVFGQGRPLGRVVGIEAGLSDPHNGGGTVLGLQFASGAQVMYKPKNVRPEAAFQDLLAWLNQRGTPLPLRTIQVLPRAGYGWAERVLPASCTSPQQARSYFVRAGMLLALIYALAGADCHHENLIAAGEHPVLVDLECLLHARPAQTAPPTSAWALAADELDQTVLGTGMLPSWEVETAADGSPRARDVSALHTPDAEELTVSQVCWAHVNTDAMTRRWTDVKVPPPPSQPQLDGLPLRLADHTPEVLDGFRAMYRVLQKHREELLAATGPLAVLRREPNRFVFRGTRAYGALQQRLREPAHLRDGADWSVQVDQLAAASLQVDADLSPQIWQLIRSERHQLLRGDVPLFTADPLTGTVTGPGIEPTTGCLIESGSRLLDNRLGALDDADLARQQALVRAALYTDVARQNCRPKPVAESAGADDPVVAAPSRVMPVTKLVSAACELADAIAAAAVAGPDGSVTWIAPQYHTEVDRYQLQPLHWDLNTGSCGVALFLATAHAVTGTAAYRDVALAAVQPVRDAFAHDPASAAQLIGLGGATGLGSVIHGLVRIGTLLGDSSLVQEAVNAALLVDSARLAKSGPDVFDGAAGALLGLLTVSATQPDAAVLDRAVLCGDHLLDSAQLAPTGRLSWRTLGGRFLTGFSHGAAGVAYALLRLCVVTGDPRYRIAAEEAIEHELALFDHFRNNWPDLREPGSFRREWCHGAPGIGLARIGGLDALDTAAIRTDIDAAIGCVRSTGLAGPDHLCCGNAGRGELLLTAATRLGQPDLLAEGRLRASAMVRRAQAAGWYELDELLPGSLVVPGLLQGVAGIGHHLLRAAEPSLPSVLLWA